MRIFDSDKYQGLKAATRRACELASPLVEIVKHTRLDAGTISRAGNPHESNFLPVDVAIDLDSLAGEPVILRAMANALGYDLVPKKIEITDMSLTDSAGLLAKEAGELVKSAIDANRDRRLSPNEARELIEESDDVAEVIERIRRPALRAMAG